MPDPVWAAFPGELKFAQGDVDLLLPQNDWPPQPAFAVINAKLFQLVTSLAQYARNHRPKPAAVQNLKQLMADQVAVVDNTSAGSIANSADPIDRFKAIDLIASKGFIRFGCYAPTTDATDKSIDGAPAMFLTFNAPNEASSATVDKAMVIRPIYKGLVLTKLIVSFARTYVTARADRPRLCLWRRFHREKPKSFSLRGRR